MRLKIRDEYADGGGGGGGDGGGDGGGGRSLCGQNNMRDAEQT